MKKKIISLLLAVTTIFSMVSCGTSDKKDSSSSEEEKLTMWVHISNDTVEGKAYKKRVEAFNAEYNGKYEVSVDFISRGGGGTGYDDKLNAALTTNTLPDVFAIDGPTTSAYAKSEVLLDINEYISEESKNDFIDSALSQGLYNDGLYSLPIQESTCGIYYNKDMFLEAGLINSIETADEDLGISVNDPWTFDEFKEISTVLKEKFNKPAIDLHLGSQDEWITYALTPFVWTSGGEIVSEDGLVADGYFNSDETIKGLSFLKELVDSGITTTTPQENGFEVGIYPMSLSSSWTVPILNVTYKDQVPDWGFLPYPVGDTKKLYAPTGSWAFGVAKTSKNPEAAALLAEWMTNTESTNLVSEATGLLPARKSAIDNNSKYDEGAYKVMKEQLMQAGKTRPQSVGYPEITFSFQQAVDRVCNGQDPKQTANQVSVQLDTKLGRHKR